MAELALQGGTIRVVRDDITRQEVDAIVNAANAALVVGGGVDHAIHSAAGPELDAEKRRLYPEGCATGGAVTTGAGRLPARHVIHAVGPVWHGGRAGEDEALASAWRSALGQALAHECRSVAFPSLSTGAYGFPVARAAAIAIAEVAKVLGAPPPGGGLDVTICAFSEGDREAYERALDSIRPSPGTG